MRRTVLILLAVTMSSSLAVGQPRRTQTGRELDASFRVGGGLINSTVSSGRYGAGNSYVTGQVTGGYSFRGRVPYAGKDQLHLTLPSEMTDNFRRDSIGVSDVLSRQGFGPRPYSSEARTVAGTVAGAGGGNRLGTGVSGWQDKWRPVTSWTVTKSYADRTAEYAAVGLASPLVGLRVDTSALPTLSRSAVDASSLRASRPQVSLLFGVLEPEQSDRVEIELSSDSDFGQLSSEPDSIDPSTSLGGVAEPVSPYAADAVDREEANEDAFMELRIKLREKARAAMPKPTEAKSGDETLGGGPSETTTTEPPSLPEPVVISRLSGGEKGQFPEWMRLADAAMRQGRYYQAASRYQVAATLRPIDPLPLAGASLAYLAAGEPYRAGRRFGAALDTFPALMAARIDLGRLLAADVAARRIGEVVGRLPESPTAEQMPLVLLVAMHYANQGDQDAAKRWGLKLAKLVADRPILKSYAKMLIEGNRPAEVVVPVAAPAATQSTE